MWEYIILTALTTLMLWALYNLLARYHPLSESPATAAGKTTVVPPGAIVHLPGSYTEEYGQHCIRCGKVFVNPLGDGVYMSRDGRGVRPWEEFQPVMEQGLLTSACDYSPNCTLGDS